jgi:hypothetical protein
MRKIVNSVAPIANRRNAKQGGERVPPATFVKRNAEPDIAADRKKYRLVIIFDPYNWARIQKKAQKLRIFCGPLNG